MLRSHNPSLPHACNETKSCGSITTFPLFSLSRVKKNPLIYQFSDWPTVNPATELNFRLSDSPSVTPKNPKMSSLQDICPGNKARKLILEDV